MNKKGKFEMSVAIFMPHFTQDRDISIIITIIVLINQKMKRIKSLLRRLPVTSVYELEKLHYFGSRVSWL